MALQTLVSQCVFQGIQNMYTQGRYSDIQIVVQNKTYHCHKLVLASVSKYFDTMFSCGMRESKDRIIELHDIEVAVFDDVIEFLYTGKDIINCENVDELLQVSCIFQIQCLQNMCEDFMFRRISVDNCLGVWNKAKSHNCLRLLDNIRPYILHNFENICKRDDFLEMEKSDLISLLNNDAINITEEELVWKCVLRWVEASEEDRHQAFPELFSSIRLALIELTTILNDIDSNVYVRRNESCMKRVKEAIFYHTSPARRHTFPSLQSKYRKYMDRDHMVALLGRRENSNGDYVTEFVGYDYRRRKWYSLPGLSYDVGDEFSTCQYGEDVFLSGGIMWPDGFMRFSSKLCRWVKKSSMMVERFRHTLVASGQALYAVAGFNYSGSLQSIDEYDIETDTWCQAGELIMPVSNVSAAVLNGRIYVFGGRLRSGEETPAIQCFDIKRSTCSIVADFPSPNLHPKVFAYNQNICIVTSTGTVFTFGTDGNLRVEGEIENMNRRNFGLQKFNGCVYVFGGVHSPMGDVKSQLCLDVKTFSSTTYAEMPESMPIGMEISGCHRIVMQKKFPLAECSEAFDEFVHIDGSNNG